MPHLTDRRGDLASRASVNWGEPAGSQLKGSTVRLELWKGYFGSCVGSRPWGG